MPQGITIDENENIYFYVDYADSYFDTVKLPASGDNIVFVKVDNKGSINWVHYISGIKDSNWGCHSIAFDKKDGIYIALGFQDTLMFDNSSILPFTNKDYAEQDIALVKYDTSGNLKWVNHFEGSGARFISDIEVDSESNIFLAGNFFGLLKLGADSIEEYKTSGYQSYILKMDRNGKSNKWYQFISDSGLVMLKDIALDSRNNLFVSGQCSGNVDFDGYVSKEVIKGKKAGMFLAKFSAEGATNNVIRTGSNNPSVISRIAINQNDYVIGSGSAYENFSLSGKEIEVRKPGSPNVFTFRIDNFSNLKWLKQFEYIGSFSCPEICLDEKNGIYCQSNSPDSLFYDINGNLGTITHNPYWGVSFKLADSSAAIPLDLNPLVNKNKINLFPNPTSGQLTLLSEVPLNGKVEVFNNLGQLMFQDSVVNQRTTSYSLPEGIFIFKISTDKDILVKKVIVIN